MSDANVLFNYRLKLVPDSDPNADGGCVDVWELAPPSGFWNASEEHFRKHVPQGFHLVAFQRLDLPRATYLPQPLRAQLPSRRTPSAPPATGTGVDVLASALGGVIAVAAIEAPIDNSAPSSDSFSVGGGDAGGGGSSSDR